jgi:hypothetical protein
VSRIENGLSRSVYLAVFDGADVIDTGPMAGFTVNAGLSARCVEFRAARRSGGVAAKTLCGVCSRQPFSESMLQAMLFGLSVSRSYIHTTCRGKGAYLTLIEDAPVFQKVSLAVNS